MNDSLYDRELNWNLYLMETVHLSKLTDYKLQCFRNIISSLFLTFHRKHRDSRCSLYFQAK